MEASKAVQLKHNYKLKAAENDTSAALTNALKKRSADCPPWVIRVAVRQGRTTVDVCSPRKRLSYCIAAK
jgi:hypothetical protein